MPRPDALPNWVLGALVSAVIVTGCSSSTHRRATPGSTPSSSSSLGLSPATTAAVPTTPALPKPVQGRPAFDPQSVTFVSSAQGWAWGPTPAVASTGSGPGVLARTYNYGRTWSVEPTPGIDYAGPSDTRHQGILGVRFTDSSHGFLFGDALFATADSGITWSQEPTPHPILDIEAGAGMAYALIRDCSSPDQCPSAHLYQIQSNGRRLVQVLPPSVSAQSNLVVHGANVYLLSGDLSNANGIPGPMSLWVRTGGTWQRLASPCGLSGALGGALAAWSDIGLALVCGGEPSAGQQLKTAYSSSDGGHHWQLAAGQPSSGGYVSSLAAAGPTTWVLGEARGQLEVTHDAGHTWTIVDPTGSGEVDEGFWGFVGFTDATHGVAVTGNADGSVLAFTLDGAHTWTPIRFPGAG